MQSTIQKLFQYEVKENVYEFKNNIEFHTKEVEKELERLDESDEKNPRNPLTGSSLIHFIMARFLSNSLLKHLNHLSLEDLKDTAEIPLLVLAYNSKNYAGVIWLLNKGVNPDTLNADKETILQNACEDGRIKMAQCLLNKGANPNSCNKKGQALLWQIFTTTNDQISDDVKIQLVDLLLKHGADPNFTYIDGGKSCRVFEKMLDYNFKDELTKFHIVLLFLKKGVEIDLSVKVMKDFFIEERNTAILAELIELEKEQIKLYQTLSNIIKGIQATVCYGSVYSGYSEETEVKLLESTSIVANPEELQS